MVHRNSISIGLLLLSSSLWAGSGFFENPQIHTSYSLLLQEKQSIVDSLLPELDGDAAFEELLRSNPKVWSLSGFRQDRKLATSLDVEIVYLDGIREDQYCRIVGTDPADALQWHLEMGVDFVSGGSTVVDQHIRICLQQVRDSVGYAVERGGKVVKIPPRRVLEEFDNNRIHADMDPELRGRVNEIHKEVRLTGRCPRKIEDYILLLDVYRQVANTELDIVQIEDELDSERNGGKEVTSCAFSREHNEKYEEEFLLRCSVDDLLCIIKQSEDGTRRWDFIPEENFFRFRHRSFLFIPFGKRSIDEGGIVGNLRLIPLSKNLYLEAYLGGGELPLSLGLLTIGDIQRLK